MKWYAQVRWCADDVATLRPDWTEEQCEEALSRIEKHLQDRTIELGWEVMDCLLNMDEDEL